MSKLASRHTSGSDLKRVDAHVIKPHEYKELPELTDAMLARAVVNKGGRPKSPNPRVKPSAFGSLRRSSNVGVPRVAAGKPAWPSDWPRGLLLRAQKALHNPSSPRLHAKPV